MNEALVAQPSPPQPQSSANNTAHANESLRSVFASTPLYLSSLLFSARPSVAGPATGAGSGGEGGGASTLSPAAPAAVELAPPPEHLFGDYVEMVYLGLVIVAGTTINAYVLFKLLREKRRKPSGKSTTGFFLLKVNLNLSDLLILVVHALGKLVWLAEYEWRFGEALCRLFNFLSMFTLYLSSNIVVCIAMDRLRTVLRARKPTVSSRQQSLIRVMVAMAWVLAFLWSLPQLYFWRTLNVFPEYPGGWIQCSDIWSIERHELMRNANHKPINSIFITNFVQNLYDLAHLESEQKKSGFFAPSSTPIQLWNGGGGGGGEGGGGGGGGGGGRAVGKGGAEKRQSRMKKSATTSNEHIAANACQRTRSNATTDSAHSHHRRQVAMLRKGGERIRKRFSLALPASRQPQQPATSADDKDSERKPNGSIDELSSFLVERGGQLEERGRRENPPSTAPRPTQQGSKFRKKTLPPLDYDRQRPSISSVALISSNSAKKVSSSTVDHQFHQYAHEVQNTCDSDSVAYSTYQTSILDLSKHQRPKFLYRCYDFFYDCVWSRIRRVKQEISTRNTQGGPFHS